MNKMVHHSIKFLWVTLSLLPLWVLYLIADALYFPLYYLIRYRRKVVRKNLINSFPDKDLKEIIHLEKKFYAFFCDLGVETLKMYSISTKEMKRRMTFEGLDEAEKAMGGDKSLVLYLGHYCNWEWVASLSLHINKNTYGGQIYHPLTNATIDQLFLKMRDKFGGHSITMNDTLRRIINVRREGKQFMLGFISDQVPGGNAIHYWLEFFHQKGTPVFTGTERIARQTESVVYFLDVTRPKRGYYHAKFILMTTEPQKMPENALTDMYFQMMEHEICRAPHYWLWTHNRWKRQKTN